MAVISTGGGWRFAIDLGGTFTDIVAWDPDGAVHTHKLLSRDAGHGSDAAVRGIGDVLARRSGPGQGLPPRVLS